MIRYLDGDTFAQMMLSAARAIENARQPVNELNVFPVPDGDTGTNMSLTMAMAASLLQGKRFDGIGKAADAAAAGMLRGARGNSGVILSLLFRGFAKRAKGCDTMGGAELAEALQEGVASAYRAVMKPAEGTVLTVSRVSAERAAEASAEDDAAEYVLRETLLSAEAALLETVHQNPVLQKAGVIDAGAKGYCVILDGMLAVLEGREIAGATAQDSRPRERADFTEYAAEDIQFAYCTEFIVLREDLKQDPMRLRAFLGSIGDSLVLVDDDEIIKVHVHTNHPGKAMEEALRYGSLTSVKVDNMREQHTSKVVGEQADAGRDAAPRGPAAPRQKYGFVAVCAGEGIKRVFLSDLGVTGVIEGGQTMNPSTEDILRAVEATPAETVFVLPNNKNIIMAAEQCVPLSEKQVVVLPTKTVAQGMAAMLAFDPDADPERNRAAMTEAFSGVSTGSVTYAARESSFDGKHIREGDHMALLDGKLLCVDPDRAGVLTQLAQEIARQDASFITVFYGEGIEQPEAEQALELFARLCPSAEVNLLYGGQPVYFYLISVE